MNIREKAKISRLYQEKYLPLRNIRLSSQNNSSVPVRNVTKIHQEKSTLTRVMTFDLSCQNPQFVQKSPQIKQKTNKVQAPILLKNHKIPNSSSVPMRMKNLQYEEKGPQYQQMLNRISQRKRTPETWNRLKQPSSSSKQSNRIKNRTRSSRKNKSMSNVVGSFKSPRQRQNWLENFKELFMKNKNKQEKKSNASEKYSRLGEYRNILDRQIGSCKEEFSYRASDKNYDISHTEDRLDDLGKKMGKSIPIQRQKQKNPIRAVTSEIRNRKIKNNVQYLKRQKHDESDLRPWNYEIQEF